MSTELHKNDKNYKNVLPLTHHGILDLPVEQVYADFVADLELALWFLGWHVVLSTCLAW